jgi:hypothetical protein
LAGIQRKQIKEYQGQTTFNCAETRRRVAKYVRAICPFIIAIIRPRLCLVFTSAKSVQIIGQELPNMYHCNNVVDQIIPSGLSWQVVYQLVCSVSNVCLHGVFRARRSGASRPNVARLANVRVGSIGKGAGKGATEKGPGSIKLER